MQILCEVYIFSFSVLSLVDLNVALRQGHHLRQNRRYLQIINAVC